MSPLNSRTIDDKKFMWDGRVYETEEEVRKVAEEYKRNNFDVNLILEDGNYLLYTRRVVKEVIVEDKPSA